MPAATAAASRAHNHHRSDAPSLLVADASGVGVTDGLVDVVTGCEVTVSVGVGVAVTVVVAGSDVGVGVGVGVAVTVLVFVGWAVAVSVSVAVAVTVSRSVSDSEPLGSAEVGSSELSPGAGVVESLPGTDGKDAVGLGAEMDAVRLGRLGVAVT